MSVDHVPDYFEHEASVEDLIESAEFGFMDVEIIPDNIDINNVNACPASSDISRKESDRRMHAQLVRLSSGRASRQLASTMKQEYSALISSSSVLYSTQKESLLRHNAHIRFVCRCHPLDPSTIGPDPWIPCFLKLASMISQQERPRLLCLLQSMREGSLWGQEEDNDQVILGDIQIAETISGCSHHCVCDCLVCGSLRGDGAALKSLGTCFHQGFGVPQDFGWALSLYRAAAALGMASAHNSIGFMYQEGHGVAVDRVQGLQWYMRAAAHDKTAQYNIGCAYYNGYGVAKNEDMAFKWYLLAAMNGDVDAMAAVGDHYFLGSGIEKDLQQAFYWHLRGALAGSITAQATIGHYYYFAWFVQRDLFKAFEWHHLAAKRGCGQAQFHLGHMYYHGEGCTKDSRAAYSWWLRSSRNGCTYAMHSLAKMYKDGIYVKQEDVKADYWMDQAARFENVSNESITYAGSRHELNQFRKYLANERITAMLLGTDARVGQKSPLQVLNKQSCIFDCNLIGLIASFAGDAQLHF